MSLYLYICLCVYFVLRNYSTYVCGMCSLFYVPYILTDDSFFSLFFFGFFFCLFFLHFLALDRDFRRRKNVEHRRGLSFFGKCPVVGRFLVDGAKHY